MIDRCDKCGKAFTDKSEVKRHKMCEHIVPVPPFEEVEEEDREEKSPYQNMEETKTDEPDIIKSVGQLQNPQTIATSADANTIKGIDDNNTHSSSKIIKQTITILQ